MATLRVSFLSALVLELLSTLSVAIVAVGIGFRVVFDQVDLTTAFFVLILAPEAYLPVRQVGVHYHDAADGMAAAESAFAIIEAAPAAGAATPSRPRAGAPLLELDGLSHTYPGGRSPALARTDFVVHTGDLAVITGASGTGKTTLLNALASTIPAEDRIVLIEETSEILIDKPNLVRFEARRSQAPLGQEAPLPAVTIADLLRATLRHRPDRILVGEVRGLEAFDLLQALNTGHQGALSTIHANSAEQALARLAHCVLTANTGLPHHSTREAIALAIHLVVHIDRVGRRRTVTDVVSLSGYDYASDRFRLGPVRVNV
jgi:ABC-type multidrug transport system fused ATPase/permease subunit